MEFIDHLWRLVAARFGHGVALIIVPIAGVIGWIILRYLIQLSQQAWCFIRSRRRALRAVGRIVTREGATEGKGVWLTTPIHHPDNYGKHPAASKILAIANLKGGVGKTTLTANIGAFLAQEWGKRVLLIDLDFQGSLSSMALPQGDWVPGASQNSAATMLISNDIKPNQIPALAQDIPLGADTNPAGRLKIIPAYYDLAQADNRIMVEWLLQCGAKQPKSLRHALVELLTRTLFRTHDVRYTLAEVLHSDAIRDSFDVVIIDCPPRLTTSEMQAFCASSHLLIPTIFDRTSAEAVVSLCNQVETLKAANICPNLKYVGVVGTMWKPSGVAQRQAKQQIQDDLAAINNPTGLLPTTTFVPHAAALVNDAADGIAYIAMPDRQDRQKVRDVIEELAVYVAGQMGIPSPPNFQPVARAAS